MFQTRGESVSKVTSFLRQALLLALPITATCLYPLITLAATNRIEIPVYVMLMPALIATVIALAIGSALALIRKPGMAQFASILLSAFILFTFAFRDLVVGPAVILAYFFESARAETVGTYLWFGLAFVGLVCAILMRRLIQRAFGALTAISIALMLIPLVTTPWKDAIKTANRAGYMQNITGGNTNDVPVHTLDDAKRLLAKRPSSNTETALQQLPDLQIVVLDAYGRDDVIQSYYGYDNQPFLNTLRSKGFSVATRSHANYTQTVLSVASMLNFKPVEQLKKANDVDLAGVVTNTIDDAILWQTMRKLGHKIISVPSGTNLTAMPTADLTFASSANIVMSYQVETALRLLIERTPLSLLSLVDESNVRTHRQQLRDVFRFWEMSTELTEAKATFVHVLAPHPPFVFDANGGPVQPDGRTFTLLDGKNLVEQIGKDKYRAAYVAQLQAINAKVLSTISTIDANPHRDTITVIVGDHGPRMNLDWASSKGTDMDEVKGTLMAVRVPERYKTAIGDIDKCSPLILLHRIATKIYGAQIPPVDDFSYYSTLNEPFTFVPMTNPTGRKDDPAAKRP
jgi:hypothetical protein